MNYGSKEGRAGTGCSSLQGATTVYGGIDYSAVYDFNTYIGNYSDIKNAFAYDDTAALEHFVKYGILCEVSNIYSIDIHWALFCVLGETENIFALLRFTF